MARCFAAWQGWKDVEVECLKCQVLSPYRSLDDRVDETYFPQHPNEGGYCNGCFDQGEDQFSPDAGGISGLAALGARAGLAGYPRSTFFTLY